MSKTAISHAMLLLSEYCNLIRLLFIIIKSQSDAWRCNLPGMLAPTRTCHYMLCVYLSTSCMRPSLPGKHHSMYALVCALNMCITGCLRRGTLAHADAQLCMPLPAACKRLALTFAMFEEVNK